MPNMIDTFKMNNIPGEPIPKSMRAHLHGLLEDQAELGMLPADHPSDASSYRLLRGKGPDQEDVIWGPGGVIVLEEDEGNLNMVWAHDLDDPAPFYTDEFRHAFPDARHPQDPEGTELTLSINQARDEFPEAIKALGANASSFTFIRVDTGAGYELYADGSGDDDDPDDLDEVFGRGQLRWDESTSKPLWVDADDDLVARPGQHVPKPKGWG